jgi:hypothetical protein
MVRQHSPAAWVFVLIILLTIAERPTEAYVDPGTASYFFQLVIGGFLAAAYVMRNVLGRLLSYVRTRKFPVDARD